MKQDLPNPPATRSDTSYSGSFLKSQEETVTRTRSNSGNLPSLELGYLDPSPPGFLTDALYSSHIYPVPLLRLPLAEFPRLSAPGGRGRVGGVALGPGEPPWAGPGSQFRVGSAWEDRRRRPQRRTDKRLFGISCLKTVNSQDLSTTLWHMCNQIYALITWWKEIQGDNTVSAS